MFACLTAPSLAAAPVHGPRALVITGMRIEGDSPSPFIQVIDLQTGHSRMTFKMGEADTQSGFDGMDWVAPNGLTNSIDLPALVADSRSHAWLDRAGWRDAGATGSPLRVVPPGGSPLTLFYGADRRVVRAVIDSDGGARTVTFGDWRPLGSMEYPFRREEVDATGQRTVLQAEKVEQRATLNPRALKRPAPVRHAELTAHSPVIVPIVLTGTKKSHILVQATVNGAPSSLIFDTGAANYLTTDAAPRFAVRTTGGINLGGVGESSSTGGYATVDRIALGAAALRNETMIVGPSPFPKVDGKAASIDGFTGFEFLAEFITTIDYPGEKLVFATRDGGVHPAGVRLRFYSDGHSVYVPATIEGRDGMFRLDTGAGDTITVFRDYAHRFALKATALEHAGSGGLGGSAKLRGGTLRSFSIGGLRFSQLPVQFSEDKAGAFASRSLAGNIGGQVLQCYRLTFDYAARSVWFDPAPTLSTCGGGASVVSAKG